MVSESLHLLRERVKSASSNSSVRESELSHELESLHKEMLVVVPPKLAALRVAVEKHGRSKFEISIIAKDIHKVTASSVQLSARVRDLDAMLRNLREAKLFVQGLDELRDVDKRLESCLTRSDVDSASALVQKLRKFEKAGFLSAIDKDVYATYSVLEQQLADLVKQQLRDACNDKTGKGVENLAKTLFAIGHEQDALSLYLEFVRSRFSEKCASLTNGVAGAASSSQGDVPVHVEAVTSVFLQVADVVQQHQRVIEEEFGQVHFKAFLSQIEYEANAHAVRVIRVLMKSASVAQQQVSYSDASEYSVRVLDFCLEELVTVIMRCKRFVEYMRHLTETGDSSPRAPAPGSLQQVIEEVAGQYVAGEQVLMIALMKKAFKEDSIDTGDSSTTWSSAVDDVFYIFKNSVDRALLTSDPNCACAVVNNVTNLIQTDLKEFLEDAFEHSKQAFGSYQPVQWADQSHPLAALFKIAKEKSTTVLELGSRDSLPHALSNIALCESYTTRFKQECSDAYDRHLPKDSKRGMFEQCLSTYDLAISELHDLHSAACKYLLHHVRGVYISPFIGAAEKIDFNMNQQQYADVQINDPFMKAFIASLLSLVNWVDSTTLPQTAAGFLSLVADYIALRMERFVFVVGKASSISILGATQIYQDVARLVTMFAQSTEVPVKAKFGRLQEICSILCLESVDEFTQIYADGRGALAAARISMKEARAVLQLRAEFDHQLIAKIIV